MEDPRSEKASEKAAAKATASSSSTTAIADKTVQVMDQVRVCPLCQVTGMPSKAKGGVADRREREGRTASILPMQLDAIHQMREERKQAQHAHKRRR